MKNNKDYMRIFAQIDNAIKGIPTRVAVLAVNFTKERFVQKNWHDTVKKEWRKTKKRKGSTLVASGRLKQSIRRVRITPTSVTIGTNVPYARIHNEGGEIEGEERVRSYTRRAHTRKAHTRKGQRIQATTVKAHTIKPFSRKYRRKFEKRQFIGKSAELEKRINIQIEKEIDKALS